MATKNAKLTKAQLKKLTELGLNATAKTTEQEGREMLQEFLKKHEIEDTEDDSFDDLVDMAILMREGSDEEMDDLADEVENEDEDEEDTEENEVEEGEEEEEDEDEEEEEPEPVKKSAKKTTKKESTKKPATKKATKKAVKDEEPADDEVSETEEVVGEEPAKKSDTKKTAKKTAAKKSERVDPINNKDHASEYQDLIDAVGKILPKGSVISHNFLANGGLSIKIVGQNSTKVLLSFDTAKRIDGEIVGGIIIPMIKDEEVFEGMFDEVGDISKTWNNLFIAKNVSVSDAVSVIKKNKDIFTNLNSNLAKKDEKLGKNREKMEADLKEEKKAKAADVKKNKTSTTKTKKKTSK